MYTFSVHTKEQAQTLQRRSWDKKVIKLYPQCPQEYREAAFKMGSLARDARAASGNTIATRILYAGTQGEGMPTRHGHPTLGSSEPSQPLGWEDTCPRQIFCTGQLLHSRQDQGALRRAAPPGGNPPPLGACRHQEAPIQADIPDKGACHRSYQHYEQSNHR